MKKNTAGKWIVFAWTTSTGLPKTGDAANITATIYIDGASNVVDDTNPTELSGGYYAFDVTAAETNGDNLLIVPASGTSGVQVIGVPGAVWTEASYDRLGTPAGASVSADLADIEGKVDDLEGRLTAARAGYLDNLSAGAVAQASELAKVPKSDGSSSWNATALAAIQNECNDALIATIADSVPAVGSRPSVAQGILMIYRKLHHRSISSTTETVKKEDNSTTSHTCTLDSATAPTSITRAS